LSVALRNKSFSAVPLSSEISEYCSRVNSITI